MNREEYMERKGKNKNFDPQLTSSNTYNDPAGGQKNLQVGPKLKPIQLSATSWTTDATTARQIQAGTQLAIYNNSATLYGVRFGQDSSVAAGAAGTVDAAGNVSCACKPNDWTYLAASEDTWVIAQNVALLVYIIDDHTTMK